MWSFEVPVMLIVGCFLQEVRTCLYMQSPWYIELFVIALVRAFNEVLSGILRSVICVYAHIQIRKTCVPYLIAFLLARREELASPIESEYNRFICREEIISPNEETDILDKIEDESTVQFREIGYEPCSSILFQNIKLVLREFPFVGFVLETLVDFFRECMCVRNMLRVSVQSGECTGSSEVEGAPILTVLASCLFADELMPFVDSPDLSLGKSMREKNLSPEILLQVDKSPCIPSIGETMECKHHLFCSSIQAPTVSLWSTRPGRDVVELFPKERV